MLGVDLRMLLALKFLTETPQILQLYDVLCDIAMITRFVNGTVWTIIPIFLNELKIIGDSPKEKAGKFSIF